MTSLTYLLYIYEASDWSMDIISYKKLLLDSGNVVTLNKINVNSICIEIKLFYKNNEKFKKILKLVLF